MSDQRFCSVLIVGTGVFGISSALHLLRRGYTNVTVIDQSPILPAPDAASSDLNKVVRSSYSDITYTKLTKEAISEWKREEWGDTYREAGVLLRGGSGSYGDLALANDKACGVRVKELHSGEDVRSLFSPGVPLGSGLVGPFEGYINIDSGWAKAQQGVEIAMELVLKLGGRILADKRVTRITSEGNGVTLEDGTELKADLILIATGAWTPSTFGDLGLADRILATGQCLATLQLTPEEAKIYKDTPVILDYTTGFYMFPPNPDNIVKLAIHFSGFTNTEDHGGKSISTPRTFRTHEDGGAIPRQVVRQLRSLLHELYPELGKKPFAGTRLCWYADTSDSDWLIDFHPKYPSVLFATGGSGHAYKFLPILGRLVADRIEGTLDPLLTRKFAFDRTFAEGQLSDLSRVGSTPRELDLSELCTPDDLLP